MQIRVGNNLPKQRCPYCSDEKLRGALIGCERCGAIYHAECGQEHGGCPATGCGKGIVVSKTSAAPSPTLRANPITMGDWWRRFLEEHPTSKHKLRLFWRFLVELGPQGPVVGHAVLLGTIVAGTPLLFWQGRHAALYGVAYAGALALAFFRHWGWLQKRYYHKFPYEQG